MASAVSSGLFGTSSAMLAVKATTLPRSLLKFPPSSIPTTLPPPSEQPTLAHPFTIPTNVYNALLSPTVPITFALVYISVVSYFNNVNAQRKHKAWPSSQTRVFKTFVLAHNVVLAAYSAWTFIGMVNALVLSFASWTGEDGLAGVVDSLCKMNGPRGLGSAATYNETSSAWQITNRAFHLAADGLGPESTDVGRMWNEGLAFYGWLFYLSKFYEVIDTAIILAKGKKSSFLQAYHHAGAMLCMWAGIRYMSPPIWMFVLVNSGIHTIMYTFYFCTALGMRVPKRLKQILTTMQISQFVIGALYAFTHLFVAYRIPVSVPYIYHLGSAVSSVASAASSGASSVGSSAVATASAGAWLKKLALRAAGREALAENVPNDRGQKFGIDAVNIVQDFTSREETRYRDELQWTHCLDTSGQVFAILLNCMYLAPLTWLFVRFFITAYSKRLERRRSATPSEKAQVASQGLQDASKGLARQVSDVLDQMHGGGEDDGEPATAGDGEQVNRERISKTVEDVKNAVQDKIGEGLEKAKQLKDELGGGIDPIAYLQNKSAEPWQRKSTTPSDATKAPVTDSITHEEQRHGDGPSEDNATEVENANDGPGEEVEDDTIKAGQDAPEETPAKQTSSEKLRKEEGVTPSPNDDGTGVKEASGASSTADIQQETTDEANEHGAADDSGQDEKKSGGDELPTASTEEPEQAGREADNSAKDTEPENEDENLEGQQVAETSTSSGHDHSRKASDIEPATPDKERAKKLLALRKASFEARITSSDKSDHDTTNQREDAAHSEAREAKAQDALETKHDDSFEGKEARNLREDSTQKASEQAQGGAGDEPDYEHVERPEDDEHERGSQETPTDGNEGQSNRHVTKESRNKNEVQGEVTPVPPAQKAEQYPHGQVEKGAIEVAAEQRSKEAAQDNEAEEARTGNEGATGENKATTAQNEGNGGEGSGDDPEQISFIEPEKVLRELPKLQPEDAPVASSEATEATPTEASKPKPVAQSEQQEKPSTPSQQTNDKAGEEKPSVSGGGDAKDTGETLEKVVSKSPSTKSKTSSLKSKTSSLRSKASSIKSKASSFRSRRASSIKSKSSQSLKSKQEEGTDQAPERYLAKDDGEEGPGNSRENTSFAESARE